MLNQAVMHLIAFSYSFVFALFHAICPPPITEMPLLVTWYDPNLGGINCDVDCSTFADNSPVTSLAYGQVAACIPEWLGAHLTITGLGTFHCRDTGGAITIAYNDYYKEWVIHVDVLEKQTPPWNYELRSWQLDWNPIPINNPIVNHTPVSYQNTIGHCIEPGQRANWLPQTTTSSSFAIIDYHDKEAVILPSCNRQVNDVDVSTPCKM